MSSSAHKPTRSLIALTDELQTLIRRRLWLQVLIGMALGIAVGILLSPDMNLVPEEVSDIITGWLALPGNLFLAIIKFVVVPLIAASVIRGIAAGGSGEQLQKLGSRVVGYFVITTVIAALLGLAVATVIKPGAYLDGAMLQENVTGTDTGTVTVAVPVPLPNPKLPDGKSTTEVAEIIVRMIPANPFETLVGNDMLQIVIAAGILGIAMVNLKSSDARPFLDLMGSIQAACMVIVKWAMQFAPLAVFGLLAKVVTDMGLNALVGTGAYVLTVLTGLVLLMGIYLLIVLVIGRKSPMWFMAQIREVMLLGFSTSSSAAVMPVSLRTAEESLQVRSSIARFVVPLGATINMGGTALYQAAAALFLAQVFSIDIGIPGIILIVVTSVGASIGAPGTPGVGIVVLASILAGIGVPQAGLALIIGVDRIVDMARTSVNVAGDLVACVVMDRWVGSDRPAEAEAKPQPA